MKPTLFLLSLAFGAMLLTAHMAPAQNTNCAARAAMIERLATTYNEKRQLVAMSGQNAMLELFASDQGSWTITVTQPSGLTCIVAAGQNFQYVVDKHIDPAL